MYLYMTCPYMGLPCTCTRHARIWGYHVLVHDLPVYGVTMYLYKTCPYMGLPCTCTWHARIWGYHVLVQDMPVYGVTMYLYMTCPYMALPVVAAESLTEDILLKLEDKLIPGKFVS